MNEAVLRRESTYVDLVLWALQRYPDEVAIIDGDEQLTYRQVADRMSQLVSALGKLGFARGNGLMVLSGNMIESLLVGLAVRCLGAWSGALHPLGSVDDRRSSWRTPRHSASCSTRASTRRTRRRSRNGCRR